MKKISLITLTAASIPFFLYAAAKLDTGTGFFYPTNITHAESDYIGWLDRNEAVGNACHLANDYNHPKGTDVYSIGPGVVESSSTTTPFYGDADGAGGGTIIIKHSKSDGTFFFGLYGHVQNPVAAGTTVNSGDKIAEVGTYTVGGTEFNHLHFGINTVGPNLQGYTQDADCLDNRNFVDPEPYLLANAATPADSCKAVDDSDNTPVDTPFTTASVLSNDTDTDGDTLSVSDVSLSAYGVAVLNNGDGTFNYTPDVGFSGTDSFNYILTDNNGCSDEGTFTITVTDSSSGGGSINNWGIFFFSLTLLVRRFYRQLITFYKLN